MMCDTFEESEVNEAGGIGPPKSTLGKEERFRYKEQDEIALLQEIILEKPFGKGVKVWNDIHSRLNIRVKDGVALRRHFQLMMKHFKSENAKSLRASGTEEDYNEKMKLLQDIKDLMESAQTDDGGVHAGDIGNEKSVSSKDEEHRKAQEIRLAATQTVVVEEFDDAPRRKKAKPDDFVNFLKESERKEHEAKLLSLQLEEKRMSLMERELKIKEMDAEHNREMDRKKLELEQLRLANESTKNLREAEEKTLLLRLLERMSEK